jgi:hypothetical protein
MRTITRSIIFGLLTYFFLVQCTGTSEPGAENQLVSINDSEVFEYRTGIGGDEEGASIKVQAKNYQISKIIRNSETNWEAVYMYKPKAGFKGIDYVELELSTGSDGASPLTNIDVIKIKFQIN